MYCSYFPLHCNVINLVLFTTKKQISIVQYVNKRKGLYIYPHSLAPLMPGYLSIFPSPRQNSLNGAAVLYLLYMNQGNNKCANFYFLTMLVRVNFTLNLLCLSLNLQFIHIQLLYRHFPAPTPCLALLTKLPNDIC